MILNIRFNKFYPAPTYLKLFTAFCLSLMSFAVHANRLSGTVSDSRNGELLTGTHISVKSSEGNYSINTVSGLNGSYQIAHIPTGNYTIEVNYMGYKKISRQLKITGNTALNFKLERTGNELSEVVITATNRGTDAQARALEKESANMVNIVSAKQIQISPDITVANVIQRVSGLSVERNSSGDPQYAVVRGMDKRYNNTLVNNIKIPSPDNENRFVPLDIFPAVFLERLEVYKSLTANMEADAIGGTVNMVMKSAPETRLLDADFQIGYNQMNFERDFITYDRSRLNKKSPKELFGETYRAVPSDFPTENMTAKSITPMPDVFANLTYGNRFYKKKLGVMLGGSFQNSYRPVSNYIYDPEPMPREGNPLKMNNLIDRETSSQLQRMAFHGKLDYAVNNNNKFSFYAGKYFLNEFRVREQLRRERFATVSEYSLYPITRFSNIFQDISIFDLRGEHSISSKLYFDWSAVYSLAKNDRPDDGVFARTVTVKDGEFVREMVYFQGVQNSRVWERNQDNDLSAYLNFKYLPGWINEKTEIQFGGVARNKTRDNYYNYYNYNQIFGQYKGVEWDTFEDIKFTAMANPLGSGDKSNLIYDATEDIYAGYINTKWAFNHTKIQAGLRAEQTFQSYEINALAASASDVELSRKQDYLTLFPSVSLKQELNEKTNLKATYFKGISRPGFYEIVPTIRKDGGGDSFYNERGNAELKPSIGHSADVRYEYFPSGVDQILVGVFYKKIIDPIEYGFPQTTETGQKPSTNTILPQNFDDATNYGIEADYTKYFNKFGIRFNYTYTKSRITTNKIVQNTDGSFALINQTRPLQGQSDHIGNISFLWKDLKNEFDAQLVLNYTGERIAVVSPYLGADHIMKPMTQLDFSVEKGFKKRFVVFAKINNILNTPYQLYIEKPLGVPEDPYPYQDDPYNITNARRDLYGQSYRLGLRYNLK